MVSAMYDTVARSYLFVPAKRLDRIEKAQVTTADVIIVDLEDSVLEQDKDEARDQLSRLTPSQDLHVRVNAVTTPHFEADVAMLADVKWLGGIVLPMVRSSEDVERLASLLVGPVPILALVETAQGVVAAEQIAASGVGRLAFGGADYAADLGATPSDSLFAYPRARLVVASVAAGIPAPVDGPTMLLNDDDRLVKEATVARSLGMGGKLCIHPSQIAVVAEVFGPTAAEELWAREILKARDDHGDGVFVVNGEMVDAPVLARAERIVAR
jgi:citrate lyase beta subunit